MKSHGGFSDRDDDGYRIVNADPATILNTIKAANYGDHNLVVYPCLGQFEEFYIECCKDSILERNDIFILVTNYQEVYAVRKKMNIAGIDAARFENDGTLVILDSEKAYQPNLEESEKYDIHILISMMLNQVKVLDKKGITLLSDLGTFILNKRTVDLLSYELSMPVRFDSNVRSFCFYHRDDFNALQEEEKKRICGHHLNNLIVS
ncbi:MAG: MEDS domain-containing protein [Thermoproteota archaeon]|nr:MEDS domain-containing protein [Thermoproteota archaeon]